MSYVAQTLRRFVADRADRLCEYCLIHEADTFFGCQIEHVIAEKHGGASTADNLAYACVFCNRFKGSDVASVLPETGQIVRLFNPRIDRWASHFSLDRGSMRIVALSAIGTVTVKLLNFNHADRILERLTLARSGRYPSASANSRITG